MKYQIEVTGIHEVFLIQMLCLACVLEYVRITSFYYNITVVLQYLPYGGYPEEALVRRAARL